MEEAEGKAPVLSGYTEEKKAMDKAKWKEVKGKPKSEKSERRVAVVHLP